MKHLLFALALTLFVAATFHAQDPTPSPTASPQESNLAQLEKKFADEQKTLKGELAATSKEIDDLKKQIGILRNNPVPDLKALVEKTNQRIDKIEEFNQQVKTGEQKLDRLRYEAGNEVLIGLIRDSGKLKVATGLSSSLTSYQNLTNPATNRQFEQEFATLKDKLKGTNNEGILEKLGGGSSLSALTSNPYISMAFSVGSLFYSKFKKEDKKLDRVNNVACVLDYTSRAAPNLKYIQLSLSSLDTKVRSFQENTKRRFQDYAKTVGYTGTWEDYQRDFAATGRNPLQTRAVQFFDTLEKDVTVQAAISRGDVPENLSTLRFQIENVKGYLTEYEAILKEVDDFYTNFISITEKSLDETSQMTVCSATVLDQTKTDLKSVITSTTNSRKDFRDEFTLTLLAPSKRILYGIK